MRYIFFSLCSNYNSCNHYQEKEGEGNERKEGKRPAEANPDGAGDADQTDSWTGTGRQSWRYSSLMFKILISKRIQILIREAVLRELAPALGGSLIPL